MKKTHTPRNGSGAPANDTPAAERSIKVQSVKTPPKVRTHGSGMPGNAFEGDTYKKG